MSRPSALQLNIHHALVQGGYWMCYAAIAGFLANLLLARGFTSGQVGVVIAVRSLAGMVVQPLVGGWADRHPQVPVKFLLAGCLAAGFVINLAFVFTGSSYPLTLLVAAAFGATELSAYPLVDTLALQYINAGVNVNYSLGRGVGSIAYALFCIPLGVLTGQLGAEAALWAHGAMAAVELALVLSFPRFRPEEGASGWPQSRPQSIPALLLGSPRFFLGLISAFFAVAGVMALSNFMVNIIQSRGGDSAQLGLALFCMAAMELPTALIYWQLQRRFGAERLLWISFLFCAVKALACLLASSVAGVYAAQLLQALSYGLFTPASVYFVNQLVPSGDRVRGQTLMMVFTNGGGIMAGSVVCGWAIDFAGVNFMLALCAASGLLGFGLMTLARRLPVRRELSR